MRETKYKSEKDTGMVLFTLIGGGFSLFLFVGAYFAFKDNDISTGVLLICFGICCIAVAYNQGVNLISGECPYCGYEIRTFKNRLNAKCKACRNRAVIKEGKFVSVD